MEQLVYSSKEYNRLILIGNGFDLALGLKTSYKDFLLSYFKKSYLFAVNHQSENSDSQMLYGDRLMVINYDRKSRNYGEMRNLIQTASTINELVQIGENFGFDAKLNPLLKAIFDSNYENWVDIERTYYEQLVRLSNKMLKQPKRYLPELNGLNDQLGAIRGRLRSYLAEEFSNYKGTYQTSSLSSLIDKCWMPIERKEYEFVHKSTELLSPSSVVFLNFNYTDTVKRLTQSNSLNPIAQHIPIHGSVVNSEENPIIFGYGDDTDKRYEGLERLEVDDLLTYIKSFYYHQNDHYHRLLGVLESSKFEVFIIGHSCGLSDKTMLKSIFEHDNCQAIKIFYHGYVDDDSFNKRIAISRLFSDKAKMRERILPDDIEAFIPQENPD